LRPPAPEPRASIAPVAALLDCKNGSEAVLWTNRTAPGPVGQLANKRADQMCLVVQNDDFSPTSCGHSAKSSSIWVYPCVTANRLRRHLRAHKRFGDCPEGDNVRWRLAGQLLQYGVPAGPPGALSWQLCLTTALNESRAAPLTLEMCNTSDPRQQWQMATASFSGDSGRIGWFQIRNAVPFGRCVGSIEPPPPPPPPPTPTLLPVANLFRDQHGAEIAVITSPGVAVVGAVQVTVRGGAFVSAPSVQVIRPGDTAPMPLSPDRIRRDPVGDVVVTVTLSDGAAMIKLTPSDPAAASTETA